MILETLNLQNKKKKLINDILCAGFEEGIRDMKPGGKRRIIIPPELGPPVSSIFLRGYIESPHIPMYF